MASKEHYHGLWRASAKESVPYNEDFPESLLIIPELWDGAIKHGGASKVDTTFEWITENEVNLIVEDNGLGIKNERRLKGWAAAKCRFELFIGLKYKNN